MQRCVAVLLAGSLGLGCSPEMARVGVASGIGITVLGFAMEPGSLRHGGEADPQDFAFIPRIVGPVILIASVIMLFSEKDEPAAEASALPKPDLEKQLRDSNRAVAWDLTKQAAAAARANDCRTAGRLDAEVAALDADFHDTVFARDAAIARCLAPATP